MILHDLSAEQAVLGALLFDNAILDRLPPLLPGHFHEPIHARLYEQICATIRAGRLADAMTIRSQFKEAAALREIGGAAYLLTLLEHAARLTQHAIDYANVLIDLAARRDLHVLLSEAAHSLSARAAGEVVHEIETGLRNLSLADPGRGCTLADAAERVIQRLDDPAHRPLKTGFSALDKRLKGVFPSQLVIVAGRPAMGKTSLATNLARGWALRGFRGHFASYEMDAEAVAERSFAAFAFADGGERFAYQDLKEQNRVGKDRLRELRQRFPSTLWIEDGGAQRLSELEASIRNTRRRLGGLDFVIVDYLQLMLGSARGMSRYEVVTEVSQGLKAMAKRFRVPIIALAQLSRENERRDDRRPQLADLKESGSIEQDADVVLGIYREAYYLAHDEPKREKFPAGLEGDSQFNVKCGEWDVKMRRAERELEVLTLKQRMGPTGSDILDFWPKYDVAQDATSGSATL